jgi:hypothetical protein
MAYGHDADVQKSVQIALAAQSMIPRLDADRSKLYGDLIYAALSDAAKRELRSMDLSKYEWQSDWVREWVAHGRDEGQLQGRSDLVLRQLTLRFGAIGSEVQSHIRAASLAELDAIGERLLTAGTLEQALGGR